MDNEAKACLDQVALDLKQQADAKAVLVGEADAEEKAMTAKQEKYAAKHKHAKVEVRGAARRERQGLPGDGAGNRCFAHQRGHGPTTDGQTEENYLVPAGATFSTDVRARRRWTRRR